MNTTFIWNVHIKLITKKLCLGRVEFFPLLISVTARPTKGTTLWRWNDQEFWSDGDDDNDYDAVDGEDDGDGDGDGDPLLFQVQIKIVSN